MEYQNSQPLLRRAAAGAQGPNLKQISRPQVTVPMPPMPGASAFDEKMQLDV
jgi:hypothetical protein